MNMERLSGACVAVVLVASLAFGQAQPVRTVEELIRIALDRNQDYLALKERVTEAQALARQAGLRPTPTLEVETAIGAIVGSRGESEYSATYLQTLERGGKREKRMAVATRRPPALHSMSCVPRRTNHPAKGRSRQKLPVDTPALAWVVSRHAR